MATHLERLWRWYSTPAGLVSLLLLIAVVILALIDQVVAAVLVGFAWLAVIIPHKFVLERRDWNIALSNQTQKIDELSARIDQLEAENRTLSSSLSGVPTVEEIVAWQQGVETAQKAENDKAHAQRKEIATGLANRQGGTSGTRQLDD